MPKAKDPNYRQPNRAQILERERRAWQLRVMGRTLQEIADDLKVSRQGAHKILERVEERERRRFELKRHPYLDTRAWLPAKSF